MCDDITQLSAVNNETLSFKVGHEKPLCRTTLAPWQRRNCYSRQFSALTKNSPAVSETNQHPDPGRTASKGNALK